MSFSWTRTIRSCDTPGKVCAKLKSIGLCKLSQLCQQHDICGEVVADVLDSLPLEMFLVRLSMIQRSSTVSNIQTSEMRFTAKGLVLPGRQCRERCAFLNGGCRYASESCQVLSNDAEPNRVSHALPATASFVSKSRILKSDSPDAESSLSESFPHASALLTEEHESHSANIMEIKIFLDSSMNSPINSSNFAKSRTGESQNECRKHQQQASSYIVQRAEHTNMTRAGIQRLHSTPTCNPRLDFVHGRHRDTDITSQFATNSHNASQDRTLPLARSDDVAGSSALDGWGRVAGSCCGTDEHLKSTYSIFRLLPREASGSFVSDRCAGSAPLAVSGAAGHMEGRTGLRGPQGLCQPEKSEVRPTFLSVVAARPPSPPSPRAGACGGGGRASSGGRRAAVPKLWSSGHTPRLPADTDPALTASPLTASLRCPARLFTAGRRALRRRL